MHISKVQIIIAYNGFPYQSMAHNVCSPELRNFDNQKSKKIDNKEILFSSVGYQSKYQSYTLSGELYPIGITSNEKYFYS